MQARLVFQTPQGMTLDPEVTVLYLVDRAQVVRLALRHFYIMGITTMSKLRNGSAILCALVYFASASAQNNACEIRHLRVLETDDFFNVVNLGGVVFPPRANSVLVLDQPISGAGTILLVPPGGLPGEPGTLSEEISDPINITYDGRANRMFLFERSWCQDCSELVVIYLGDRLQSPNAIQRFAADEYGVDEPGGIAVDPETGTLFILDGLVPKIVEVVPTSNRKNYDGAAALAEGRISEFPIQKGRGPFRGLGFNHSDGGLYVFSPSGQELYQIAEDGRVVHVGDLSGPNPIDPQGFVFAPSLDQTDDAKQMNLYIASSGGPSGIVTEWSLKPCVQGSVQ